MSVTFTLTSLAIAAAISATSGTFAVGEILKFRKDKKNNTGQIFETRFQSKDILVKTLKEHGFDIREEADGNIVLTTKVGKLRYFMDEKAGTYMMQCFDLMDDMEMEKHCAEIEEEYMNNVQKSTYMLLKERLKDREDMELDNEEFLEDGTILLTINV